MGLQAKDNSLENFRLGLFVKDPPGPVGFDTLEDDVGNDLEDDVGNLLSVPQ